MLECHELGNAAVAEQVNTTVQKKRRAFALAGVAGALSAAGLLSSCTSKPPAVPVDDAKPTPPAPRAVASPPVVGGSDTVPPPAPREFRAAWVSTVANIDWPSRSKLPADKQQAEAI